MPPTHTPTPWIMKSGLGIGTTPYFIGETADGKRTPFQALKKEDAAFIVRAVNCHEELLGLVKDMQKELARGGLHAFNTQLVMSAEKAIARAEQA